jgi:hypothetical protein
MLPQEQRGLSKYKMTSKENILNATKSGNKRSTQARKWKQRQVNQTEQVSLQ